MMKSIKAVLLDMDGLMLDTERLLIKCRQEAWQKLGIPEQQDLSRLLLGRNSKETQQIIMREYGSDYPYEAVQQTTRLLWNEYMLKHGSPDVRPGLFYLLDYLQHRKIPCAVGSTTPSTKALPMLKAAGIAPYLSAMVFGDMVKNTKPAPDIFLEAAALLHVAPEHCLVLEDSPNGIRAANQAKAIPVMVPDIVSPDKEMEQLSFAIVHSLFEVPGVIEKMEVII